MSRLQTVVVVSLTILLIPILAAFVGPPTPPLGGLRGVREFFTSGTFTVPSGVSHVMVTMWGAGGGGGAGSTIANGCTSGGGGGGGAYTNTVVPVTARLTYTVTVGSGGTGGVNAGDNGTNGGNSQFALSNTLLAFAGGGQGGTGGTTSANGTAGSGGQADGPAQISHAGFSGGSGPVGPALPGFAYATNLSPGGVIFPGAFSSSPAGGTLSELAVGAEPAGPGPHQMEIPVMFC
jgi:hypothetical protein